MNIYWYYNIWVYLSMLRTIYITFDIKRRKQQHLLLCIYVSNYIHCEMYDEITYSSRNLNGASLEVWESISNFTPPITRLVISYICFGSRINRVSKPWQLTVIRCGYVGVSHMWFLTLNMFYLYSRGRAMCKMYIIQQNMLGKIFEI